MLGTIAQVGQYVAVAGGIPAGAAGLVFVGRKLGKLITLFTDVKNDVAEIKSETSELRSDMANHVDQNTARYEEQQQVVDYLKHLIEYHLGLNGDTERIRDKVLATESAVATILAMLRSRNGEK